MKKKLIDEIHALNPGIEYIDKLSQISVQIILNAYNPAYLMQPEWDSLWMILIGPRQSGKTTMGKHLCSQLIQQGRYQQLLF